MIKSHKMTNPISQNRVVISGVGSRVPEKILTNDELAGMVDTSDEWIKTRTGISERRIAGSHETTSDMAAGAALAALENGKTDASEIDLLIVATISPDTAMPATACYVQEKAGLKNAMCFDMAAACSGFVYALDIAYQYILTGAAKKVMVVGADKMSALINWQDRTTCVLFGDGAGAVILEQGKGKSLGIMASSMKSDGSQASILHIEAGGAAMPLTPENITEGKQYITMEGSVVFKSAVRSMSEIAEEALAKAGLSSSKIAWLVPHQANKRILTAVAEKLGISMERVVINLEKYGNTTAGSIPLALDQAVNDGRIKDGDYILFVAFGAGATWGATVLQWGRE